MSLHRARHRKARHYRELDGRGRRCRLVVFGVETGGRWSAEAATFVRLLARSKARSVPRVLRKSAQLSWSTCWTAILSVAAQRDFAALLLQLPMAPHACVDGDAPPLGDVLGAERRLAAPYESRLPARG